MLYLSQFAFHVDQLSVLEADASFQCSVAALTVDERIGDAIITPPANIMADTVAFAAYFFAYYSKTEETPKVKIATKADMSDAKEVEGKQTQAVAIEGDQYYSNKASVNDLKENTTYYYQVFQNGKYQDAQKYSTKSLKIILSYM